MLLTSAFMVVLQFFKAIGGNDDQGRYFEILMFKNRPFIPTTKTRVSIAIAIPPG